MTVQDGRYNHAAGWQDFENGFMVWIAPDTIFVVGDTGWWNVYQDGWDGEQVFYGAPPEGCRVPQNGFGWVWANHTVEVADRLGYATGGETSYQAEVEQTEFGWRFSDPDGEWRILSIAEPEEEPGPEEEEPTSPPAAELVTYMRPWHLVELPSGVWFNVGGYLWIDPMTDGTVRCRAMFPVHDDEEVEHENMVFDGRWVVVLAGEDAAALIEHLRLVGIGWPAPLAEGDQDIYVDALSDDDENADESS